MEQNNIMFMGKMDNSNTMVDLYENNNFFGYKDSYNYYDIDVKKILLIKNSYKEYFIRYYDVNKMKFVPLQLKTKNFYNELNTFANNNRVTFIHNDGKKFLRKCREIWNNIIELIGINNPIDFVNFDDDANGFITANVYKGTSFVNKGNYDPRYNKVVIGLHSVIKDCLETSLVQHRY